MLQELCGAGASSGELDTAVVILGGEDGTIVVQS